MGRYLEEIKNFENAVEGNRQNRQNPTKASFVSFVGSPPASFEKNISQNGFQANPNEATANHAELTRLVRQCGERYSLTEAEHAEALILALADPEDARKCFQALVAEVFVP